MKKLKEIIDKHPIKSIIVAVMLLMIIPSFVVHVLYKIPASIPFFEYVIPPGNMLAYVGSVLTFSATFSLSILVYRQNKKNAEKSELLENRTFISIDTDEEVEFSTPSAKQEMSLMFETKINVLSNTRFSNISLKYIGIRDDILPKCNRNFSIEFLDKNQPVHFQYIDRNKAKISFGILKVDDTVMSLFQELEKLTVGLDIDFICEKVLTPISITLMVNKVEENNMIEFMYNISEVYVHHHKERFI